MSRWPTSTLVIALCLWATGCSNKGEISDSSPPPDEEGDSADEHECVYGTLNVSSSVVDWSGDELWADWEERLNEELSSTLYIFQLSDDPGDCDLAERYWYNGEEVSVGPEGPSFDQELSLVADRWACVVALGYADSGDAGDEPATYSLWCEGSTAPILIEDCATQEATIELSCEYEFWEGARTRL